MSKNVYEEFLRLLGWEGDELKAFLPEWRRAADFLGLSEIDVFRGLNEWIPKYWDLEFESVRKCIAYYIREAVEVSKTEYYMAMGHKVIYTIPTSSYPIVYANNLAGEGKIHSFYPDYVITTVRQAFFGLFTHNICKHENFSTGCLHCTLNSNRARLSICGRIAAPTLTVNCGLECAEAAKAEEQIDCSTNTERRAILITIPHDAPLGTVECESPERVDYLTEQLKDAQKTVESITGCPVTDDIMRSAMSEYRGHMEKLEELTRLVVTTDPQPMSGLDLTLLSSFEEICFATDHSFITDILDTALREVRERIAAGRGVLPAGSPKLACHFQSLSSPWLSKAFPENGVNIALGRLFPPISWLTIDPEEDPVHALARYHLMNPNVVNIREAARLSSRMLSEFRFDGALYGSFVEDRWIGSMMKIMVNEVEKETGIPHFYLESSFWEPDKNLREDRMLLIRNICNSIKILDF